VKFIIKKPWLLHATLKAIVDKSEQSFIDDFEDLLNDSGVIEFEDGIYITTDEFIGDFHVVQDHINIEFANDEKTLLKFTWNK
jgi:hypothetical protein